MRSESQVELSLAVQRLFRNSISLLFLRALYWCSGRHCADGGARLANEVEFYIRTNLGCRLND